MACADVSSGIQTRCIVCLLSRATFYSTDFLRVVSVLYCTLSRVLRIEGSWPPIVCRISTWFRQTVDGVCEFQTFQTVSSCMAEPCGPDHRGTRTRLFRSWDNVTEYHERSRALTRRGGLQLLPASTCSANARVLARTTARLHVDAGAENEQTQAAAHRRRRRRRQRRPA